MDTIHPYFTDKARAVFTQAGGDPDNAGPLAAWAQAARPSNDRLRGVIIAATGEILAQTRHARDRVGASYITAVTHDSDSHLINTVVDLGTAALTRRHGQALHVTFSTVCLGARQ